MHAVIHHSPRKPGIESYSATVLMQWARKHASDLRVVAVTREDGTRMVAAKFMHAGNEMIVTAVDELELSRVLVVRICELRGWPAPGYSGEREQVEAEAVRAMVSGDKSLALALARDIAVRNEQRRGYRGLGAAPTVRVGGEGWRQSSGPKVVG